MGQVHVSLKEHMFASKLVDLNSINTSHRMILEGYEGTAHQGI